MPTLIYAPAVRVVIATRNEGIIDVSADLVRGSMVLSENSVGQFSFSLTNQRRKYDGIFSPNDRIRVQFKRLGPNFMQSFTGYLNNVPFLSLYPRTIDLEASCTLKRLQYQLWDSGALESIQLLTQVPDDSNPEAHADGGMRSRIISLVNKVGGWPETNIHVGLLPEDWFAALAPLEEEVATQLGVAVNGHRDNLGGLAILGGLNPLQYGTTTAATPTEGQEPLPPGAGTIPAPGKVTINPALADNVVQMRWGYYILGVTGTASTWISPAEQEQKSIQWWASQKILLVNPKNNRMIHCTPGAWGPEGEKKDFAIGLNAATLSVLQATEGDGLEVRLGSIDAALGEFNPVAVTFSGGLLPQINVSSVVSDWSIPAGMTDPATNAFAWHSNGNGRVPLDQLSEVVTPAGAHLKLHPVAASAYVAMRDEALKAGIRLNPTDGYRDYDQQVKTKADKKDLAAEAGTSNHGWGMALDMGQGCDTFTGAGYKWLEVNAGRYGWVNPNWAKYGKGGPKVVNPSAAQQSVMQTILSVGQGIVNADSTLTARGKLQVLLAAFETGWVESNMTNLSGGDRDSLGVFQQRPSQGWGTAAEIMNVTHAATKFFQAAVGSPYKNNKGTAGQLAQSVQRSGFPTRYDERRAQALAGLRSLGVNADGVDGAGAPLTGPEPWHWEFWAGIKYAKTPYAALPKTAGGEDPNYQAPGSSADGTNGMGFATDSNGQLVNINWWYSTPDTESEILVGERALMNDDPLLDFVGTVCQATMRSYMAAPNGDFISWFPDYFGHFGIAGRMSIEDIELQGDGFTMTWSDSHIVTHQFVMGAMHSHTASQYPGGVVEAIQKITTSGIVSIDFPKVLGALLNITATDPRFKEWIDKDAIYKRYGARKDFQTINTIVGAQAEFWCACYLFMKKWAQQFSTRVFFTWMPEVYPGMILEFPSQKVQVYCTSVTHSFDFQGGGFQTSAVVIAPSGMDGSGLPLPKGGSDPG